MDKHIWNGEFIWVNRYSIPRLEKDTWALEDREEDRYISK